MEREIEKDMPVKQDEDVKIEGPAAVETELKVVKKEEGNRFRLFYNLHKKLVISSSVGLIVLILALVTALTDFKYVVLSPFIQANVEVPVIDSKTSLPVQNASVTIDNQTINTGRDGIAKFSKVHLGKKKVLVKKVEYKDFERDVKISTGTNILDRINLESNINYAYFAIKNAVSDLYVEGAEVEMNGDKTLTDSDGIAKIKIKDQDSGKKTINISKEGFIDLTADVTLDNGGKVTNLKIVPQGKNYFLSNRRGKIDVYSSNLDGSQQTILLEGTGLEDNRTAIFVSPNSQLIALISTREGLRGVNKNLLTQLYLIDISSKSVSKLKTDEEVSVLGWSGNNIVFTSANGRPGEDRVMKLQSYNINTKQYFETVSSGFIYARLFGEDLIYSLFDSSNPSNSAVYSVKVGDVNKTQLLDAAAFQFFMTSKDIVTFSSSESDSWYNYNVSTKKVERLAGVPPVVVDKSFTLSPDKSKAVFLETRDGKTDLYLVEKDSDKKLTSLGAVTSPMRWLNDEYVVFHVVKESETADYVISTKGGSAQKISDIFFSRNESTS